MATHPVRFSLTLRSKLHRRAFRIRAADLRCARPLEAP